MACNSAGAALNTPEMELTSPNNATASAETPAACKHLPQCMAATHVADFVREHRDQLVVILRQLHEFIGHDDDARRQRERVGANESAMPELELIFVAVVERLRHVREAFA